MKKKVFIVLIAVLAGLVVVLAGIRGVIEIQHKKVQSRGTQPEVNIINEGTPTGEIQFQFTHAISHAPIAHRNIRITVFNGSICITADCNASSDTIFSGELDERGVIYIPIDIFRDYGLPRGTYGSPGPIKYITIEDYHGFNLSFGTPTHSESVVTGATTKVEVELQPLSWKEGMEETFLAAVLYRLF